MCPYAFSHCPEGPASGQDTFLEGQLSFLFSQFFGPPSTGGLQTGYFVVSVQNFLIHRALPVTQVAIRAFIGALMRSAIHVFECCEHIRPSQEALGSVYSLPDLILVVLDRDRYIPLAIHNIAKVGLLVGGVDFLDLQGHISSQLTAYSHYPALGGIHSHFPSARTFGYGIQCGFSPGMREVIPGTRTPRTPLNISLMKKSKSVGEVVHPFSTPHRYSMGLETSFPTLTAIFGASYMPLIILRSLPPMPTDRSLCSMAIWEARSSPFLGTGTTTEVSRHVGITPVSYIKLIILFIILASGNVGDGSAITSFHTSDGTPSAPGALLFGVSASASVISDHNIVLSHSG
ncbi:hypothetical protein AYI70_g2100 [Smittium culicis]|uniref:Uncharacterized protein n=1 Tax=Smittium culicis TaxID=133412 RepID=A0A1R1Y9X4_9FUNG|nr:hypothetical protein AYI70_g2100 [Smittium culicis]